MQIIQFDIARAPHSLNTIIRMNWRERSSYQNMMNRLLFGIWMQNGRHVFRGKVIVKYTIYFPTNRRRDIDNYIGGTKYFTDALKQTFLLRDDSDVLKSVVVDFESGPEKTTVRIEEVNDVLETR